MTYIITDTGQIITMELRRRFRNQYGADMLEHYERIRTGGKIRYSDTLHFGLITQAEMENMCDFYAEEIAAFNDELPCIFTDGMTPLERERFYDSGGAFEFHMIP